MRKSCWRCEDKGFPRLCLAPRERRSGCESLIYQQWLDHSKETVMQRRLSYGKYCASHDHLFSESDIRSVAGSLLLQHWLIQAFTTVRVLGSLQTASLTMHNCIYVFDMMDTFSPNDVGARPESIDLFRAFPGMHEQWGGSRSAYIISYTPFISNIASR